ncbi:hypothetical protein BDQ17DRAFT_1327605 [Cyathus striatus]|nr:hypothetical protein BDQ17DRAFT_1327605 [Cyathus striatus]
MSAHPPSPKANSLKTRKSMLPAILGSSRNPASKLAQQLTQDIANENHPDAVHSPANPPSPPSAKITGAEKQTDSSSPLQRPHSKSRTILRLITTKLTPRSASSSPSSPPLQQRPSNRLPTVTSAFASKDHREAALRERGLLPPLKPNKDLSKQEREQDLQLPAVALPDSNTDKPQSNQVSAANLIKKEWEAKNRNTELEHRARLNSFRFGGSSQPTSDTPTEPNTSFPPVVVPTLPNETPATPLGAPPLPPKSKRYPVPPALDLKSSDLSPDTPTKGPLSPSLLPLPASPLPSSPKETSDNVLLSSPVSPALLPLPPSPSKALPETPKSRRSTVSSVGNRTPTPQTVRSDVTVTPSAQLPAISFTPPTASTERVSKEGSLRSASRNRAGSIPTQPSLSGSISSSVTPSLEASSSQSTGLSSPVTPESSPILGRSRSGSVKTKATQDYLKGGNIPMIVESPVEEGFVNRFVEESPVAEELAVIVEEGVSSPATRLNSRGLTDPLPTAAKLEKRKTLNPFKRGQSLQPPISSDGQAPKRLSVSASLSNLRRSVVGTVSRPKSTIDVGASSKMFNASHLPPSPTSPTGLSDRSSNSAPSVTSSRSGGTTGVGRRPRQAIQPTLHSRGSILLETAAIEDEESRRMTELAFLG